LKFFSDGEDLLMMEIMTLNDSSHSDTSTTSLLNHPSLMTTPDANLALLMQMSPELVGAYIMAQQFASLTPEQAAAYKADADARTADAVKGMNNVQVAAFKAKAVKGMNHVQVAAFREEGAKNDGNDFLVCSSRTSPHLNLDSPPCQISRCFCASNQRLCPREALLLCPSHLHFQIVCVLWGFVCRRGAFISASQRKRRSRPDDKASGLVPCYLCHRCGVGVRGMVC
jgi:hypothetical protein